MALCAPRFPENLSGIASCSEMGSTHSCTLHSGLAPLALSCGELAVEPASCLEPTTSLALCTPRFPDVLSGIASCTDMGSRPSCTLHSGLPTFAPRCDEHAGGPGSYRRASNVLEASDTDPPSTVPSSGNAARIACRDADASLAPCTVPLSKGIAGIARCSRPEPSCFSALLGTRLLLSAEWIGHAPLDSALFNQSAELVPSAKVLSSASSGPHLFPDFNVPPPGSLHLCMPFAQLQVCFLAFVATLCYRSVPTVHYRVRRRLRAHVNVMNAAGDRLPRTSPLHAFRPGIRIAKGLRFASSYIFFQWHARRTRILAARTARVARHALARRFPRSSQCTCDGTRLLASAADYVYTRSSIALVALCYGSIALLLGGAGLFLLACHAFALRSAFDLPPGACALALALLLIALRPLRYCFCCSAGWFTTAMRFLALATGCRGPCDIGFEPYPLCSAPNKCLQDACGTALLRSPSFSPREAFARDEFTRVLPLLFANASPTLCGASRSQRVSPDVPLCESRLSYTLLDGLARASGLSIRVVYVNSAQRTV